MGSVDISINKAFTARAFDVATRELAGSSQSGERFCGINASNGGRVMIFAGSLPLAADGKVVDLVGVSGCDGSRTSRRPKPRPPRSEGRGS